jgi:hypothetical protein
MPGPLSITLNTTGATTALPLFEKDSTVRCAFVKVEQDKNDKGDFLSFQFKTLDPAPAVGGREINTGFPVFKRVFLYDKNTPPGQVPERAVSDIARIQDACLGTGDKENDKGKPERPPFGVECIPDMVNKEVFITFTLKPNQEGVDQNEIKSIKFPGDVQA